MSDMQGILRQRITDSLTAAVPALTPRGISLPEVTGKAEVVIGMRRSGSSAIMWQFLAAHLAEGSPV